MTRIISIDVRGAFYDPENVPEWANGMTPTEMGIAPIPPAVNVADYNDDGFVDAAQLALGHARTNDLLLRPLGPGRRTASSALRVR